MKLSRFLSFVVFASLCYLLQTRSVSATIIDVTVSGGDAIFLAGRTDIVIPPITSAWNTGSYLVRPATPPPEAVLETLPPFVRVVGGDVVRVADLGIGGINFLGGFGAPFAGTNGIRTSLIGNVTGLDGISGFNGSVAALNGVFLGDAIPNGVAPATLDFSPTGLGIEFLSLAPQIGQVFYIADGITNSGASQAFIAPSGSTRFFLGLADAFNFYGQAGYYGDNDGSYRVRVGINQLPSVTPEPSSLAVWMTGVLCVSLRRRRRLR